MNVILTIFAAIAILILLIYVYSKLGWLQKINAKYDNSERFRTILAWMNVFTFMSLPLKQCINNWNLGFANNVCSIMLIFCYLFFSIVIFQHIKYNKKLF